jgi:hypothetical protein
MLDRDAVIMHAQQIHIAHVVGAVAPGLMAGGVSATLESSAPAAGAPRTAAGM